MEYPTGWIIVSSLLLAILILAIRSRQRRQSPKGHTVLSGPFEIIVDGNLIDLGQTPVIEWPTEPQIITLDYEPLGPIDTDSFLYWFLEFTWAHNRHVRRTFNTYGPAYHRATTETSRYD